MNTEVLVFKTSIKINQVTLVKDIIRQLPGIIRISFDLEDCDNILRVESNFIRTSEIESLLKSKGIHCKELED